MGEFRPSSGKTYKYGGGQNLEIVNQNTLRTASNIYIGRNRSLFGFEGPHFRNYNDAKIKIKSSRKKASSWWNGPDVKRKRRIAKYKYYAVEGKVKSSVEKGYRWLKTKWSKAVHGL